MDLTGIVFALILFTAQAGGWYFNRNAGREQEK